MSAPASAWLSAWRTSTATVSSLRIAPSSQQAVMAVAGIGIERHVGEDADIGHGLLDGAAGPADQVFGVERLAADCVPQARIGVGKQRHRRDAQLRGALGLADDLVDAEALDARHRGDGIARVVAVDDEERPDEVVDGQHVLAHEAAGPVGLAVAAGPVGQVQARTRGARRRRRPAGRATRVAGLWNGVTRDAIGVSSADRRRRSRRQVGRSLNFPVSPTPFG